ncbi:hypothetical protein SDC9_103405 [bioreactor metagenome]|uniref:Type 4 fimbrial biogenesis protein PilX N-terminal domain-containing protein n=1 Tax=bioreactor metagenome TaxID=1076179 RepID=A0A645AUQ0_9ZZZZ
MKRGIIKVHNNERGAALIFVILALVIVSILAMAIASLVRSNLSQTVSQEDTLKAYYLATSGQELAYAALLKKDAYGDSLLSTEFTETAHPDWHDAPILTDILNHTDDGIDGGTVNVKVEAVDKGGERWVKITSTGIVDGSAATKTVTLEFMADNTIIQVKS